MHNNSDLMVGHWWRRRRRVGSDSCVWEWSRILQLQPYMRPVFPTWVLSKSKLSHIPHSLPICFSGYSCRLVTHGMSLIIVNEDSLDVSRSSTSCTLCTVLGLSVCVCVCVHSREGVMWWGLKQATVGTRVRSTARLVGVALCVLTGAGN